MKKIYRFIFFRLMGWQLQGSIDEGLKKCVMIVVPHTSWVDFFIGVLARGSIGLEMHYVAKKELFRPPLGAWFRWMGGAPLDRKKNENKVDAIAAIFRQRDVFRLAIAPEGTRKKVEHWKTGFYYIALKAGVPVVAVAFDYGRKEVAIAEPYYLTGNREEDVAHLETHYRGVTGYVKEYSYKPDSMKILEFEKEIICEWKLKGKNVVRSNACDRIDWLRKNYLIEIAYNDSEWLVLYQDPEDKRFWELRYEYSEMHGGGPPSLICINENEVRSRYNIMIKNSLT